jgi:hypothetical protein
MIFRQIEELKSGRKTKTRRVAKDNEVLIGYMPGTRFHRCVAVVNEDGMPMRIKYQAGRTYPVIPKMFQKPVGRHTITGIKEERLHDITEEEAIAEGVNSVAEYKALWESINTQKGTRWTDNPRVFVYTVEWVE